MDVMFNLVASSISALVARMATHPIDTLKTRLQYSNLDWKQALKFGSFRSLYNGLGVTLLFSIPATSVYLTTYDEAKSALSAHGFNGMSGHALAGATAELMSSVFWTPMEVLKSKLQAGVGATSSLVQRKTWDLAKDIYRLNGLLGFYRGYFLAQLVFIPYTMIYFTSYEQLKRLVSSKEKLSFSSTETSGEKLSLPKYIGCASLAGAFAGGVSNIFDVVKTRVQVTNEPALHVISQILKQDGLRGFTRGVSARILWVTPSMAISIVVYEMLKEQRDKWTQVY